MMRAFPRRYLPNALSTYVAQVILALQVVVVTPMLVHGLGPELYGIWALVASVGLMFSLLDLGLGSATIRYVAHHEAVDERREVIKTVAVSFWILVILASIAMAVSLVLAPLFALHFAPAGEEKATALLVVLAATSVALMFIAGAFGGCFAGLQYHSVNNAFNAGLAILQAAFFALALALGGMLVALGVVLVLVAAFALVARYEVLRRIVPGTSVSTKLVDRVRAKQILGMTTWISSMHAATVIRYRIDTLVVGFVAGVRAAGIYAVGQLLFVAVDRFIQPAFTGFFPFSAELARRRDREGLRAALVMGTRLTLAIAGALCLPVIVLAGPLIDDWVGPHYLDARPVVVYLVSALLLSSLTKTGFAMLEGSGHYRVKTLIVWIEAVLNLGLSIALGLLLGMQGVALATLIATAAVSTAVGLPYICHAYHTPALPFLWGIARAYIPAAGVALVVAWVVYPGLDAGFLVVMAAGAAIALAYWTTLVFTGVSREERTKLWAFGRPHMAHLLNRLRVATRRLSGNR